MERSPFETAAEKVRDWLDFGSGSPWARRDSRLGGGKGHAWDVDLQDDTLPVKRVRVALLPDFPASPCELYVDKSHFLKVPHVESDGHVCIGIAPIPEDYDDPVGAVKRALRAFNGQLIGQAGDPQWIEEQFHSERASYWLHYCNSRRKALDSRPVAKQTYVDFSATGAWAEGTIAAYIPSGSKHRRYALQIATTASVDPQELAARHNWASGTLVRGSALFVRLDDNERWTPASWPMSFKELDMLVSRVTNHDCSLVNWASRAVRGQEAIPPTKVKKSKKERRNDGPEVPPGQPPLLVVLAQGGVMFGYQVFGTAMALLQPPAVEPVFITRVDADWALARDHDLALLHARRKMRVLLLGNGSLGSPLAKALARSGIGQLDIVDAQLMGVENTSRHELGLSEVGQSKAHALARQLKADVPGLNVRGYLADAPTWVTKNCTPGAYDLVVECTAESTVRTFISTMRSTLFGNIPIIHAWTEPLCSAGHVVLTQSAVPWPVDDPADTLVNASDLPARDTRVDLPACSDGFHPYGAADIQLIAAFAAERIIAVFDDIAQPSTIWSWVRSSAFFATLPAPVTMRPIVPISASKSDSATTTRELSKVLRGE
ncbi:ThiF family adenylyltransferase [Caballeronia sordidicola]|uniref:ThiF family adenylyltransferase n=1 Tax=Caballeronia sordidicola TaxID=196367 RepID=UPI000B7931E4|nr:ThiF family adenylyltransferase [Caballeronia sordidicola]